MFDLNAFGFAGPGLPGQPAVSDSDKASDGGGLSKEAAVKCKSGHVRWVDWERRHDSWKCASCPMGRDQMTYAGVFRW